MGRISAITRVDNLTGPPVVGQRYFVPTVTYPWHGKVDHWPVMGPKHTDAEHIGFEPEHYHVDIRFLTEAQIRRIERAAYDRGIQVIAAGSPLASRGVGPHPAPVLKRLTCRRADNAYPRYAVLGQSWFPRLNGAYAGRKCGRNAEGGLICPHKGFALGSLVPDEHGRVVCPLHGLVIDVARAEVVDALARPNTAAPEVRT